MLIPIWVGLATCVLNGWHKGTKVHHNMTACACSKRTPQYICLHKNVSISVIVFFSVLGSMCGYIYIEVCLPSCILVNEHV